MPPTVYLNSSDYSNLSLATADGAFPDRARWLGVRKRLIEARASGKAVFRFSYPIIMEAYPTAPEHLDRAVGRAKAIKEICGPHCLVYFLTLMTEEARSIAARGSRLAKFHAWRDDGAWHPNPDGLLNDSVGELRSSLPSLISQHLKADDRLNRKSRKQIERAMFSGNGAPSKALAATFTPELRRN